MIKGGSEFSNLRINLLVEWFPQSSAAVFHSVEAASVFRSVADERFIHYGIKN